MTDKPDSPEPVPTAPRAVAVAIGREQEADVNPRVVAKGQGKVAEQILEIAFARGVKVRSDSDLAQILQAVEVESEVPLVALAAVAEILTYVYRTASVPAEDARQ